ncbi:decapping enzyme complex catalytic subunit [Martiniozyma asiatica (nom. inval.)]|nr:decapping enzyme complex catalytic subunit [Martiniozyma asiatica]
MSIALKEGFVNEIYERCLEDLIVRFVVNCPEEDLSTYERVLFQFEEAHWFYLDYVRTLNPLLPPKKMKPFTKDLIKVCPMIWKWGDPDEALSSFGKYKSTIPVRGCALLNENMDKVLLVKGVESNSWSFPRGKISKDEKDVDCALRELDEETGFDASDLIDEDAYVERTIRGKNYKIYIVKNVPEDTVFDPKAKFEITDIQWYSIKKLNRIINNNGNNYFLVNTMLRPIMSHINRWKAALGDDELKRVATEQLKKLLGVGVQSVEEKPKDEDPGRDLLSYLQSAAKKFQSESDNKSKAVGESITTSSQTQQNTSMPIPMMPSMPPLPFIPPFMTPFMPPFMSPFMPPRNVPWQYPHMHQHHYSHHQQNTNYSNNYTPIASNIEEINEAPSAASLNKPALRSKVANSKELLSILTSKSTTDNYNNNKNNDSRNTSKGLLDLLKNGGSKKDNSAKIVNPSFKPIPSESNGRIRIMKREKSPMTSFNNEHMRNVANVDITQPANETTKREAPASANNMLKSGIKLLKKDHNSTSDSLANDSEKLLSILQKPNSPVVHESQNQEYKEVASDNMKENNNSNNINLLTKPNEKKNIDASASLLNLLKKPSTSVAKVGEPAHTHDTSSLLQEPKTGDAAHLLSILKNDTALSLRKSPAIFPETTKSNDGNGAGHLLNILKSGDSNSQPSNQSDSASSLHLLKGNKNAASSCSPSASPVPFISAPYSGDITESRDNSAQLLSILKRDDSSENVSVKLDEVKPNNSAHLLSMLKKGNEDSMASPQIKTDSDVNSAHLLSLLKNPIKLSNDKSNESTNNASNGSAELLSLLKKPHENSFSQLANNNNNNNNKNNSDSSMLLSLLKKPIESGTKTEQVKQEGFLNNELHGMSQEYQNFDDFDDFEEEEGNNEDVNIGLYDSDSE